MEFNYEMVELEEFTKSIFKKFEGIDSVIVELEKEITQLETELAKIKADKTHNIKIVKRKPIVIRELGELREALKSAKEERHHIEEAELTTIDDVANPIRSQYYHQIESQLLPLEKEVQDYINMAKEKISEIYSIRNKGNAHYNHVVVYPINKKFDLSGNRKALNVERYNFTKKIEERI